MNATGTVRARGLWIALGALAVVVLGVAGAAAAVVHSFTHGGFIHVAVDDHGGDPISIRIAVPAVLAGAALTVAPHAMPAEARAEVRHELERYQPLLRELAAELERCPDATLVEVEDGTDHVVVRKEGNSLIIRVRSDDADVDVQVPVALAGHALRAFG
jgi:hypothetical protein